ncbi:MAG TPA: DUF3499 family protein [Acidimicrobiia bacterium]
MRICERPGCHEPATASFTFNSTARAVWLDHVGRIHATAGHLCHRHAAALTPPVGWELHDRRALAHVMERRGETVAADHTEADGAPAEAPEIEPALDAHTPLLARAFRGARRAS